MMSGGPPHPCAQRGALQLILFDISSYLQITAMSWSDLAQAEVVQKPDWTGSFRFFQECGTGLWHQTKLFG